LAARLRLALLLARLALLPRLARSRLAAALLLCFAERFADYCYAAARHVEVRSEGTCYFTPVNEPSFLAYAGGHAGLFAPHLTGRGEALKIALCRATIAGIEAIWAASQGARIVNVDPLCHVATPVDRPEQQEAVEHFNNSVVFESLDMLAGRLNPELGGSPAHLDIVGVNYYWTNQWEWGAAPLADGRIPPLADDDPRGVEALSPRHSHHRDGACGREARRLAARGGAAIRDPAARRRAGAGPVHHSGSDRRPSGHT